MYNIINSNCYIGQALKILNIVMPRMVALSRREIKLKVQTH